MAAHHWDAVWSDRAVDQVTWFQAEPTLSLRMIQEVTTADDGIIDVGGGASRLVDRLLEVGYRDLTVLDIAAASIDLARTRLGDAADRVNWITADITAAEFDRTFDLWHDRAVFHFLVDEVDRIAYLAALRSALVVGGHVVLSTFGPDGPTACSGLPVRRYGIELMQTTLGGAFDLVEHRIEQHLAPNGTQQQFVYGLLRRTG